MPLNEFNKILHEGFLIKTQIPPYERWKYNIVRSIYNDKIVVDLTALDNPANLIGREIYIKANSTTAEYVSKGIILDINTSPPFLVKVQINQVQKYNNRRRFERYLTNLGCNIKVSGEDIGSPSLITNIGFGGAYLETNVEFSSNPIVKLDIITENNITFSLNAKILRKDILINEFGYGIVFINNSNESLENLKNLTDSLQEFEFSILQEWQKKQFFEIDNKKGFSNLKILIVDDVRFTRSLLTNIMQSLGITKIYEASNGSEAIHKAILHNPDIITLDISMPGINGIETVEIMKNSNIKSEIIVISAFIDSDIKEILSNLGIKYYIPKPFQQTEVVRIISKIAEGGKYDGN